mmetsp:Transcript_9248/g.4890  ORF Transcript_9248/g.4890 Transcript_9248/m.4890 type:complete len:103 (+) Transcript_9248:73-381(+)
MYCPCCDLDDWRLSNEFSQEARLRLFDAGCGNGYLAHALAEKGYEVAGCDFSEQGIALANNLLPDSRFEVMSVYDNMADVFGGGGILSSRQRSLNIFMILGN